VVELQRILIDEEGLNWDDAWGIVTKTYSFTNHTVLPEALERWAVPLIQDLLPRLMMIIFDVNLFFLQDVEKKFPGDREKLRRMSIIEEGHPQYVRMAFLACVGSHTVNGVAALHSELVKSEIFKDYVDYFGASRFTNVTNGITPRRWLNQANPGLGELITDKLGSEAWVKELTLISGIKKYADDPHFQVQWMNIKRLNKVNAQPSPLLSPSHTSFVFSGKSAPGYYIAKLIIKLINNVAEVVNADPVTSEYLKLIFIPNYNVSVAEIIIPASDISQHISTAGTEASGTSNMKFVLNGGLIIGTVDGGKTETERGRFRGSILDPSLAAVVESVRKGEFGDAYIFEPLMSTLTTGHDFYIISHDFASYIQTLSKIDVAFKDKAAWAKKSILAAASMGKFSSDRSIRDYAEKIWHIKPVPQE
ncbi:Non-essential glycogen phosphorylase, partial [Dinochytrium kinnereticum]